jgi:trigger factor
MSKTSADKKPYIPKFDLKIDKKEREDGKIVLTVTVPGKLTADLMTGAAFILALQNKINLEKVEVEKFAETVIEKVGEAQYTAFINHYAMTAMAPYAILEKGITPIMEPEVNSSDQIAADRDFTFVAVVTPKPHYELSSYDPVTVKLPKVTVTEQEIDQQIYNLAERSAYNVPDEGAIIWEGKEVVFAIETHFTDTGDDIPHMTAEKRVYKLGDGFLPEEFDKGLLGLKAGESKTFDFDLPGAEGPDGEPGLARTVTTTVTITQINKRVVPDINDTWVITNMPDAKNVDGLRELLRKDGEQYKNQEAESAKFFLVASTLAERFIGFIPDEIYEYTRGDMMANLQQTLKAQNINMEQYTAQMGMDEQTFNMHFMMNVRESLRQGFSLDALARHLKLTINEEDIADTLTRMAPENEDKARADIEGSGRNYLLTEAALRTKANKWLLDTATFTYED